MPANKDKKGLWRAQFYYSNSKNEKKKMNKRGFKTKKEALEWERNFLAKCKFSVEMSFKSLIDLYIKDMKPRIKESTMETKIYIINNRILTFFNNYRVEEIKPVVIREWQNELLKENLSQTYIRTIQNQLTAIFNYAVKFHNLKENPCHKAGSIGKKDAEEMNILSLDEFTKMIECVTDVENKMFYIILFWTGIRKGELMALTYKDINIEDKTLSVNKTLYEVKGKLKLGVPKTPKSKRIISINTEVIIAIENIRKIRYNCEEEDRIFNLSKHSIKRQLDTACKKAEVNRIRVHDLRHSHASYLLANGINIVLVSKRLGHEKVQTTLNTYSHVCNESEDKLARVLNI